MNPFWESKDLWATSLTFISMEWELKVCEERLVRELLLMPSGISTNTRGSRVPILTRSTTKQQTEFITRTSRSNIHCLVSVAGTLTLEKVKIEVQIDAGSFVLFDVKGGELVMDAVHISGVPSSSAVIDGIEGLCSWETGLIKLHDAEMETHSCEFSSIDMGEIWMESSNLSLISTEIVGSGSRFSLFPSAQQDVMCES
ncbi:hypothetical protein BLNAU_1984 [Blattamonas nauphoetae]|uniref:Auto-transporter adhesin head GIN domain-containing protein n=1 Tax=Blattamonas nauphoetae TaxID=2049346 RepID=A0ABQ9YH23_9EUKA|nr:hypothetical protein BLNAU_1984 [Blattamonas nauphoetae]